MDTGVPLPHGNAYHAHRHPRAFRQRRSEVAHWQAIHAPHSMRRSSGGAIMIERTFDATRGTMEGGMHAAENDDLLSLPLSSKGGEGNGAAASEHEAAFTVQRGRARPGETAKIRCARWAGGGAEIMIELTFDAT